MSLTAGLSKTRKTFFERLRETFRRPSPTREALFEEVEAILLGADVGVDLTVELLDRLRARALKERLEGQEAFTSALRGELLTLLPPPAAPVRAPFRVILLAGVNGAGKTTTLGKLAHRLRAEGEKVMVAAADTFRAAASEQLSVWAGRAGVPLVQQSPGADPAAVAFDGLQAARARGSTVLLVDTAGRLHTKANLMAELRKIQQAVGKPPAPRVETYLVLDGTGGQNTLAQAREFNKAAEVTGIIITKLDGTAKGGFVFAVAREIKAPIVYVGTGEGIADLHPFEAQAFVKAFFSEG